MASILLFPVIPLAADDVCVVSVESWLFGIIVVAVKEVIPLLPPPLPPTLPLADELLLDEYERLLCWFGSTEELAPGTCDDDMLSEWSSILLNC